MIFLLIRIGAFVSMIGMEDIIRKPPFWGLDPLFHAYVKLFAGMLGRMVPGAWGDNDSVYFYSFVSGYPRPVRLVSIAGVVIYLSKHQKFTRFLIDDGTGTARCMLWTTTDKDPTDPVEFSLGDFVEIRGRLEWCDRVPLVSVESHEVSKDPHAELLWWVDYSHTYEKAYLDKFRINLSAEEEASLSERFSEQRT